ncbi:MAG: hypothetical protein ACRD8W_23855, partial [Nitrososphaeraceae archaeon]
MVKSVVIPLKSLKPTLALVVLTILVLNIVMIPQAGDAQAQVTGDYSGTFNFQFTSISNAGSAKITVLSPISGTFNDPQVAHFGFNGPSSSSCLVTQPDGSTFSAGGNVGISLTGSSSVLNGNIGVWSDPNIVCGAATPPGGFPLIPE